MTHPEDLLSIRDQVLAEGIVSEDVTYLPLGLDTGIPPFKAILEWGNARTTDFDAFGGGRHRGRRQMVTGVIGVSVDDVPTPSNQDKFMVVPPRGGAPVVARVTHVGDLEAGLWELELTL